MQSIRVVMEESWQNDFSASVLQLCVSPAMSIGRARTSH